MPEDCCSRANRGARPGWAELEVWTPGVDGQAPLEAYAAGFLEGAMSQPLIYAFEHNFMGGTFPTPDSQKVAAKVADFLNANYAWVEQQAAANADDTYWSTIADTYTRVGGCPWERGALVLNHCGSRWVTARGMSRVPTPAAERHACWVQLGRAGRASEEAGGPVAHQRPGAPRLC